MNRLRIAVMLGCVLSGASSGGEATPAVDPPHPDSATPAPVATLKKNSPYIAGLPASGRSSYAIIWGADRLSVKLAESGQLVRFNYRVVDASKALALNDKASTPYLLDEEVHAVLQVPDMEKIGKLRQAGPPENGRTYWMAFSNKGNLVKPGHRVSVVIGAVRFDGLVVQP